jgi:small subunit ribosomal protein S15
MLESADKAKILKKFGSKAGDSGSPSVQIALMTARLNQLTGHFKTQVKDHHSRRGLFKLVGRRRRLLNYLHRKDPDAYLKLIQELDIRK